MPEQLRIGVLGLVHEHIWDNLPHFNGLEDVQLVGASDANRPLLDKFLRLTGKKTYRCHTELLEKEELDAVLIYDTNRRSCELACEAAGRGLHVMREKPMASDLGLANRMLATCREAGVTLMINWPVAWSPGINHALKLVQDGVVGRPWQLKWRGADIGAREQGASEEFCRWLYDPEENGGGSLFDYAGYGAVLARLFLGPPSQVIATAGRLVKRTVPVDDNSVVLLQYPNANAVIETSWTEPLMHTPFHHHYYYPLTLYGTDSVLVADREHVTVYTGGRRDGELIEAPPLEAPRRNSLECFAHCIRTGQPVEGICSPALSLGAQEVLEAARRSILTGRRISLPLENDLQH